MSTKLPLIRFNVKDRGRQYLGQERNFDIKKLCDSINGGKCQELVNGRGMVGFYGHAPRVLAGLDAVESAMIKGKYTEFDPAVVTTFVKAYPNGDIEHQTEILDTDSGAKVAKMYSSKVGGFSSAIKAGSYELTGFDYVINPNFNSNRPYILDSIDDVTIDDLVALSLKEQVDFLEQALAQKTSYAGMLEASLDSCQADNDRMVDMLASGKPFLDDIGFTLPLRVAKGKADRMRRDTEFFLDSALELASSSEKKDSKSEIKKALDFLHSQRG